jgi:hypothetical protein
VPSLRAASRDTAADRGGERPYLRDSRGSSCGGASYTSPAQVRTDTEGGKSSMRWKDNMCVLLRRRLDGLHFFLQWGGSSLSLVHSDAASMCFLHTGVRRGPLISSSSSGEAELDRWIIPCIRADLQAVETYKHTHGETLSHPPIQSIGRSKSHLLVATKLTSMFFLVYQPRRCCARCWPCVAHETTPVYSGPSTSGAASPTAST